MSSFHYLQPDQRALVERHRLDDLDALLKRQEATQRIVRHRHRDTLRVTLPDEPARRVVYLKREWDFPIQQRWRAGSLRQWHWSLARREWAALARLHTAGVGCPRPLACVQAGRRAALVLDELTDYVPLKNGLTRLVADGDTATRETLIASCGIAVARMHAAGVFQPDLYAQHVWVKGEGRHAGEIAFIDFQRSTLLQELPLARRAASLAALHATLPSRLADERAFQILLDAYVSEAGMAGQADQLARSIERESDRLLQYRHVWEWREGEVDALSKAGRLEVVHSGHMWVDRQFRPHLEHAGLATFESVMATQNGHRMRALRDRENWRLEIATPEGSPRGAYLKKHSVRGWRTRLRARLGTGPGPTAGRVEARNVARLHRGGIAAMQLIAYGEKLHGDGRLESFVLTDELAGYTQLDTFLRQRFTPRCEMGSTRRDPHLSELLRRVADVAARFHRLGYNHRDLYCCHFFIREPEEGRFQVNLIDLQRVEYRRRWRRRWVVKDLAQLAYSAPAERIGCTDRMAFIKHYLGVRRLTAEHKRLIRQVLAKQALMERHLGKHP